MSTDVQTAPLVATAPHDAVPAGAPVAGLKQPYHLVDPSPWPLAGSAAAFLVVFGIIVVAHYGTYWVLGAGILSTLAVMTLWWRDVWRESSTPGMHSAIVKLGLRFGVMLFITSEVMFFVSFFWGYFNFAVFPETMGNAAAGATWPPAGVVTFDPFHLPLLNTMILLLSGCTVTWAHHELIEGNRRGVLMALGLTILLGMTFTACQVVEYSDAPFKFAGGVFPSVFFLATGFHGFHVIVGTIFLGVCWIRAKTGDLKQQEHFGFEAAAWYWHFVDVVWLFLFIFVYVVGAGAVTTASAGAG